MTIAPAILARLRSVVGPKGARDDLAELEAHVTEPRGRYSGHTPLMLMPATTQEVSEILKICAETRTSIVPQGGNTGLVAGQIPQGEVLLSLTRLNRVREVDAANDAIVAEAGVTLLGAQRAAAEHERLFPLSLAAEGTATVGGALATNAGGTAVLRYGSARDLVLGLEAVLADGRVWNGLRTLRKDNSGYDLKSLFVGSEGTLCVITAAALKLFPTIRTRATAIAGVASPEDAVALLHFLQEETGGALSAFEIVPRIGLAFVLRHIGGTRDPLRAPQPWYALVEATSPARDAPLGALLEQGLARAIERQLARDAALAASERERAEFWRLREALPEAQKREGASLKHDISVPLSRIAEFIEKASAAVLRAAPGARVVAFGHIGDGNVHFNISQPMGADGAAFLQREAELRAVVHPIALALGGSISAEHGVGIVKRDDIAGIKSAVEMETMRAIKRALDPHNILNPGKTIAL